MFERRKDFGIELLILASLLVFAGSGALGQVEQAGRASEELGGFSSDLGVTLPGLNGLHQNDFGSIYDFGNILRPRGNIYMDDSESATIPLSEEAWIIGNMISGSQVGSDLVSSLTTDQFVATLSLEDFFRLNSGEASIADLVIDRGYELQLDERGVVVIVTDRPKEPERPTFGVENSIIFYPKECPPNWRKAKYCSQMKEACPCVPE